MPFYSGFVQRQAEFKTKVLVVSSDTIETSKEYFKEHGVELSETRQSNLV